MVELITQKYSMYSVIVINFYELGKHHILSYSLKFFQFDISEKLCTFEIHFWGKFKNEILYWLTSSFQTILKNLSNSLLSFTLFFIENVPLLLKKSSKTHFGKYYSLHKSIFHGEGEIVIFIRKTEIKYKSQASNYGPKNQRRFFDAKLASYQITKWKYTKTENLN